MYCSVTKELTKDDCQKVAGGVNSGGDRGGTPNVQTEDKVT